MHLYIHIPFCRQACHYCDFHFSTSLKTKSEMILAICREIEWQKNYLQNTNLETIYFGGGTPSLLEKQDFEQIFETINKHFTIAKNAEITVEANPDDLSKEKLLIFKSLNINRLSIGIQSFNEANLKFLNRIHTSSEAENCVKMAQNMGIENISVDLIYGINSPTLILPSREGARNHEVWENDLQKAIALKVPHISSYCLTIEPKTVFGKWVKTNKIAPIDDEFSSEQFKILIKTLAENNYEQYEISNFCLPNSYSKHNSSYWKRHEYLGVGPSAHSYNYSSRQYNVANNASYIKEIWANKIPCEIEILTPFEEVNDYILTTLRTKWGCNLAEISKIVGQKWQEENGEILMNYLAKDFLKIAETHNVKFLQLTEKGKLFADKIASDLFLV